MLCVSGGLNPDVHLFTQSKGKLKYRDFDGSFIPEESFQNTFQNILKKNYSINYLYDHLTRNHPYYNGSYFSKMPKLEKVICEFQKEIENN